MAGVLIPQAPKRKWLKRRRFLIVALLIVAAVAISLTGYHQYLFPRTISITTESYGTRFVNSLSIPSLKVEAAPRWHWRETPSPPLPASDAMALAENTFHRLVAADELLDEGDWKIAGVELTRFGDGDDGTWYWVIQFDNDLSVVVLMNGNVIEPTITPIKP